jgi:hypothetical protein
MHARVRMAVARQSTGMDCAARAIRRLSKGDLMNAATMTMRRGGMTMTNRLTTNRGPHRLHGQRTDPHPCFGQSLPGQRATYHRWLMRWHRVERYALGAAILAMGAGIVVGLMAW